MPLVDKAARRVYAAKWQRKRRQTDPVYAEKCREAVRRSSKKRWADPEFRFRKLKQRAAVRYQLSVDKYDAFFEAHGNRCGICGKPHVDEPNKRLYIDHCHETGVLRGTLCSECNFGLGKLGDTIEGLKQALAYLEKADD